MKYSEQFVSEALSRYANGIPRHTIAESMGVSAGTITEWAKKHGVTLRGQGSTESSKKNAYPRWVDNVEDATLPLSVFITEDDIKHAVPEDGEFWSRAPVQRPRGSAARR